MVELTFLGIENPMGVVGPKVRGVVTQKSDLTAISNVTTKGRSITDYAVKDDAKGRYLGRAEGIGDEIGASMIEDTVENRDYALKLLKTKGLGANMRLTMASSLTSMFKYIAAAVPHPGPDTVDTIILFGHGASGTINMGLNQIAMGPPKAYGEDGYARRKEGRELFGLDKPSDGGQPETRRVRDLTEHNIGDWSGLFGSVANRVSVNSATGSFHLFMIGCEVGAPDLRASYEDSFLQRTAEELGGVLGQPVIVAAPKDTVTSGHLDDLVKRLAAVRAAVSKSETVYLRDEGEKPVELATAFG